LVFLTMSNILTYRDAFRWLASGEGQPCGISLCNVVMNRGRKYSAYTYSLTRCGVWVVSILKEQYSVQRSTELVMLAQPFS